MSPRSTPDALTRARKLIRKLDATMLELVGLVTDAERTAPDRAWMLTSIKQWYAGIATSVQGLDKLSPGVGSGEPKA